MFFKLWKQNAKEAEDSQTRRIRVVDKQLIEAYPKIVDFSHFNGIYVRRSAALIQQGYFLLQISPSFANLLI